MKVKKTLDGFNGVINIPGDKSISHRSIIIPSISKGVCEITNCLESEDVMHTLSALKLMGVKIEKQNNKIIIFGKGLNSLEKPISDIYLGNSGTSARLLIGLLSNQNFNCKITGDKSLSSRPMHRIIKPLELMGAKILSNDGSLPVEVFGNKLGNKEIIVELPSAQIKSGLILAALNTKGETKIIEKNITRDHTEIMLESFGADIAIEKTTSGKIITINGQKEMESCNIEVPSDLSSSAFFIVAALINKNSKLLLKNININPTRDGVLFALKKMGGKINFENKRLINNEVVADIRVEYSELNGCDLSDDMARLMIDEYPILSIAASFANSPSVFRGLSELRVKESDRLELINKNLNKCGVDSEIVGDDLFIKPKKIYEVNDTLIETRFDHRIAMAFTVMSSMIGNLEISESNCINTSFPMFKKIYNSCGGNIL